MSGEVRVAAPAAGREPARLRALELTLVRIRWLAAAFAAFQVSRGTVEPPPHVRPLGYVLVAFLGVANILVWRFTRRPRSAASLRQVGLAAFAVDAVVVFGMGWLYSFQLHSTVWVVSYVLPLEAALRYALRGAVATIALSAASELGREFYRLALFPELRFEISSVTFRVGVLAIIALVAGYMTRSLARRAAVAERQATAFEQLAEQERQVASHLREVDQLKDLFLQAVSHELRTPLTAVLGYALTLERDDVALPAEERRDLARRLAINARKLDRLLRDLLDLDRLGRGTLEARRRDIDVAALVRRAVEEADLGDRTVHVDAEPVVASVDPAKVERIVDNLLANAARHTPAGTPVGVRLRHRGGGVELTVEDRGPGVPDELKRRVFEPFVRGQTPDHAPGTGIGLSLVGRFAELHGGRAWVEDRDGGGASFRVFLAAPLRPAATGDGPVREHDGDDRQAHAGSGGP